MNDEDIGKLGALVQWSHNVHRHEFEWALDIAGVWWSSGRHLAAYACVTECFVLCCSRRGYVVSTGCRLCA